MSSKLKRYFPSIDFCEVLGVSKFPIWPPSRLIDVHFEDFILTAESVTRIIYAWRIITNNKIVPNEIEAS